MWSQWLNTNIFCHNSVYSICILHILLSVCFSCTLTWIKGKAQWNTLSQARALAPSSSSTRSPGTYTLYAVWIERRSHTTHYELKRWTSIPTDRWNQSQSLSSRCRTSTTTSQSSWKVPTQPAYLRCHPWVRSPLRCSDFSFIHLFMKIMQYGWIHFS